MTSAATRCVHCCGENRTDMGNHFCDFSLSDAVIQRAPYVMTDLAGSVQCGAYCSCNHAAITGRKFFSLPGFGINNLIQQISQVGFAGKLPEIRGQDFPVGSGRRRRVVRRVTRVPQRLQPLLWQRSLLSEIPSTTACAQ